MLQQVTAHGVCICIVPLWLVTMLPRLNIGTDIAILIISVIGKMYLKVADMKTTVISCCLLLFWQICFERNAQKA